MTPKAPGGAKGSWGKPGPKAKAQAAAGEGHAKTYLSEGSTGFAIPVNTNMFDAASV